MSEILYEQWQPVIGLEVHVQLNTRSKLFSCAHNRFGDEPNTNIGNVCTAQPGSLPFLNKEHHLLPRHPISEVIQLQ